MQSEPLRFVSNKNKSKMELSLLFNNYLILVLFLLRLPGSFTIYGPKVPVGRSDEKVPKEAPRLPVPVYDNDGNIKFFPRIVGGRIAKSGEFVGIVSIQSDNGYHFCGGTLVRVNSNSTTHFVITAAHCVMDSSKRLLNSRFIQVMGNDLSINYPGSWSRQVRKVKKIIPHPNYDPYIMSSDIAILLLSSQFKTTEGKFEAVSLPDRNIKEYELCSVAGWGSQYENGSATPDLLAVNVSIVPHIKCNQRYDGQVSPLGFCAGSNGKDSCQGDSGGGLICFDDQLHGIVSYGKGCGRKEYPGVYTNVCSLFSMEFSNDFGLLMMKSAFVHYPIGISL